MKIHPKYTPNTDKKNIFVDIDETICFYPGDRAYELAEPSIKNIEKINKLYDEGNTITYWTGRGSLSSIDYYDLTKQQLDDWGCKYHKLITGTSDNHPKPHFDMVIDDKAKRIEEI
tara:strand:- start:133 stop:480 length:348 start_codon:yes stop_codon:yes gene_type:complete